MLEVDSLDAWYGEAQVLFGVSLTVQPGELLVLQGLNGAGKSSLLQAIMGLGPRVSGEVRYRGDSLSALAPHQRARRGLGYVPEDRRLFSDLTVQENLRVAAGADPAQLQDEVLAIFPALKGMLSRTAAQMSGGEQQMLSIARTLMTRPTLLLLDEPCEGISPILTESISEALLGLKACGMSMLVSEQNATLASRADRIITLSAGQIAKPETP
jgi:branched-chain amino acid transport system ATP-binding protein